MLKFDTAMAQVWEVVGGGRIGGLIVWEGKSMKSAVKKGRLSCGSLLREEALEDGRLCFSKIAGAGPEEGWTTVKVQKEEMVKKTEKTGMEVVKVLTEEEKEAAAKKRAKKEYESSDSEDESTHASSEPPVMLAIEDGSVESDATVPTIEYILAGIERAERREEWELKESLAAMHPPSLEEVLAGIEDDERRDTDAQVTFKSFQEIGRGDGVDDEEWSAGFQAADIDWSAVLSAGTNEFGVGLRAPDEAQLSSLEEKRRRLHETAQSKRLAGQRKRQELAQKAMTKQQASRNISLNPGDQYGRPGSAGAIASRLSAGGSFLGSWSGSSQVRLEKREPPLEPPVTEFARAKDFGQGLKGGFLNSKPRKLPPEAPDPGDQPKARASAATATDGSANRSVLSLDEMLAQLDREMEV